MLTAIHEQISGWLAILIVALLIIPFTFWGINFYFTNPNVEAVAQINGKHVSRQEYYDIWSILRQRMLSLFGGTLSEGQEELIREQAMDLLVNTEVVNGIVVDENLQVSAEAVRQSIEDIKAFQDEDTETFDRFRYEQYLLTQRETPAQFEEKIRLELLATQFQDAITQSAFVLKWEIEDLFRIKYQHRDFLYKTFNVADFREKIEASEEDIADFYENNKQRYYEPEKVKVAYIDLSATSLAKSVEFEEADLQVYYDENQDNFLEPDKRHVSRLFISLVPDASDAEREETTVLMNEALALAEAGKAFADIAVELEKKSKGKLEFIENSEVPENELDPQIAEFTFAAEVEEISQLITTEKGVHLVKVEAILPDQNRFEGVRDKVLVAYKQDRGEDLFFEQADIINDLAYEHTDSLEPAADAVGIDILETDFFASAPPATDDTIISKPEFVENSFSEEVKNKKQNSEAIMLNDGMRMVVLRILEVQPKSLRPLEEVKEEVETHIKEARARDQVKKLGSDILSQLKAEEEYAEVAQQHDFEWSEALDVGRENLEINRAILRAAFSAGTPKDGKLVYDSEESGDGDYTVLAILGARDGSELAAKDMEVEAKDAKVADSDAADKATKDQKAKDEATAQTQETKDSKVADSEVIDKPTKDQEKAAAQTQEEAEAKNAKVEVRENKKKLLDELVRRWSNNDLQYSIDDAKNQSDIVILEKQETL